MIEDPHTHPLKPTQSREATSELARELWNDLRDALKNEEAWYICERYLNEAFHQGVEIEPPVTLAEEEPIRAECAECNGGCDECNGE